MSQPKEKPFGPYPKEDYLFFQNINLRMDRSRTREEEELTKLSLKHISQWGIRQEEERYQTMMENISKRGVEIRKLENSEQENHFLLTSSPIDMMVMQHERRTRLLFKPDINLRYDVSYFYSLFMVDLPKSIYGTSSFAPTNDHIRKSTIFNVSTYNRQPHIVDFKYNHASKKLEEIMEDPSKIRTVFMECNGEGVSYSLNFPNPKDASGYVQYLFPSMHPIKTETVDVLLKIHENGGKINSENKTYAKAFADSINDIREELRAR